MDLIKRLRRPDEALAATLKVFRWASMAAILFWALAYRLGSDGSGLPQFVYVNF